MTQHYKQAHFCQETVQELFCQETITSSGNVSVLPSEESLWAEHIPSSAFTSAVSRALSKAPLCQPPFGPDHLHPPWVEPPKLSWPSLWWQSTGEGGGGRWSLLEEPVLEEDTSQIFTLLSTQCLCNCSLHQVLFWQLKMRDTPPHEGIRAVPTDSETASFTPCICQS